MSRPIEDLLRQAYEAKATGITDERLAQLDADRAGRAAPVLFDDVAVTRLDAIAPAEDGQRLHTTHSRWLAPLLAAAAAVVVAVGAAAIANSHHHRIPQPAPPATRVATSSPTGTPAPTASHGSPGAPALLASGHEAARSQILWSQVGPGWTVAQWTPDTAVTDSTHALVTTSVQHIYLVNPIGGRYLIATVPAVPKLYLQDWSGDGQRALFLSGDNPHRTVTVLDLRTGELTGFAPTATTFDSASFTTPLGTAILLKGDVLQRVGLDGTAQLSYPQTVHGHTLGTAPLYSPDGTQLVLSSDGPLVVLDNDGTFVRTLSQPAGEAHCVPNRWWSPGVVLASCGPPDGSLIRLFLIPLDGSPTTALMNTPQRLSFYGAWQVGSVTLLTVGKDPVCGQNDLAVLNQDGTGTPQNATSTIGGTGIYVVGTTAKSIQLLDRAGCLRNAELLSHDPSSHDFTVLLGGSINGGSIINAVGYRAGEPTS